MMSSMNNFSKLLETSTEQVESMYLDKLVNAGLERTMDSYYLCGPYPPMLQMEIFNTKKHQLNFNNASAVNKINENVDMYLHFPFCKVVGKYQCSFCHFFKEQYDVNKEPEVIKNWIKEIELWKRQIGDIKINTIYFGGGTPSLMQAKSLKKFVSYLKSYVDMKQCKEIKFEIHATAARDPERFKQLLEVLETLPNVKTIIDIQSFNPMTLKQVTWSRVTEEDYNKTLQTVISHGFDCISTGFITGLPFETKESMLNNLAKLVTIPQIKSITNYPLMLRQINQVNNIVTKCPEIVMGIKDRDIVAIASRKLLSAFGFTEGPLYFFSREGGTPIQSQSKHNNRIETNLLGIGPSAFGNVNDVVYYNHPSILKVSQSISNERLPISNIALLDDSNREARYIIKGGLYGLKESFSVNPKMQPIFEVFQDYQLVDQLKSNTWKLTDKGKLRTEEMAYYIAENDLGAKFMSVKQSELNCNPNHCFPTRTNEQNKKFESVLRSKLISGK